MLIFDYDNCACDDDCYGDTSGLDALYQDLGMEPEAGDDYSSTFETVVIPTLAKLA